MCTQQKQEKDQETLSESICTKDMQVHKLWIWQQYSELWLEKSYCRFKLLYHLFGPIKKDRIKKLKIGSLNWLYSLPTSFAACNSAMVKWW